MLIKHPQSWQRWFAWHPVMFYDETLEHHVTVWLQPVLRQRTSPKWPWNYKRAG